MDDFTRIFTEEEAERIKELFISDDEVKEIKLFIHKNLCSKKDWRAFGHYDIYQQINYHNGILRKLQLARNNVACTSAEEIMNMLYIMGYGFKRIIFLSWKMGFEHLTAWQVKKYIRNNKWKLDRERLKFMNLIEQTKLTVFQNCQEQVKQAEEETVKAYLEHLRLLNEELPKLDPVEQHTRCRRIRRDIAEIMETLLVTHGIKDVRKFSVQLQYETELHKVKAKIGPGLPDTKDSLLINPNITFLEAEKSYSEKANYLPNKIPVYEQGKTTVRK